MAKKRDFILLKINAIIVATLGFLGCASCSYQTKYGIPDFVVDDTTYVDTTIHCMYGVPVVKYGVPPLEAPLEAPAPEETEK